MKYFIFIFLFIFGSTILGAQDTLYVKGKREPLIVEINIVKKKTLNYSIIGSNSLRTISLKKVKKIKFGSDVKNEKQEEGPVQEKKKILVVKKEEFRSTILMQSGGLLSQTQAGLNYMHRLSSAITESRSFWLQVGGGYLAQRTFQRNTEGYYLEFGTRFELANKSNPQNRFHIGFDINNQWAKGTESTRIGLFSSDSPEPVEDIRIAIQIPIGYTYRSDNGFYLSSGLEISTLKFFPSLNFRFGYCFGN